MTSHVKLRKERVGVVDYDTQIKEVRCQLVDQLKVLDMQLEQKSQQLLDLTDYLRRRGEIEGEYARSLEKLAERFTSKIKKKEPSGQSVAQVWLALLSQTRQESRDHNGLSERCSNLLTQPLTYCLEYTQRLAKRSKEVCSQLQEGLLKATTELQTVWRTYYQYHADYVSAEGKLKDAEKLEEKQKQSTNKKVERLIEKRQVKFHDIHLKCSKARNDYLLNLATVNGCMSNYYLKDISSLIDCADAGYHLSLSRVMQAYLSSRWRAQKNLGTGLQQLHGAVSGLDQNRDRDLLLQAHHNTFCLPFRFLYQPHDGDQVSEVSAENEMRCELETRFKQIQTRLTVITQETEEAGNSLLAAHSSLLEIISDDDLETNGGSGPTHEGSTENLSSKPSAAKRKANLQETENLYVTRVREYLFGSSLESKLQAKHDLLKVAVEKAEATNGHQPRPYAKSMRMRSKSNPKLIHNQKLFTGDMLDFLKASGQEIPLIVESCICYINLNGLHHEGIFRVPGSQAEVNTLRDAFEKGDEPLAEQSCDLDSVAGVLKLYFRGLEKPLFPGDSTSQLLECNQVDNEAERAAQLKAAMSSFPAPTIVVMRYLFSFLHHVSQYSDENMMQPYNLAVCFGPSLVRCPQDDAVALQPQINSLVKNLIVQHENVFPSEAELPGPIYEKCMTLEEDDCEPMTEEGDGDELETRTTGDRSTSPSPAQTQKKGERLRANSRSKPNPSASRGGSTGGAVAPGVKFALQLPMGPQGRTSRTQSPGFLRREGHDHSSSEDINVHVNKEVCRQMDSVFKELLTRQTHQDPSSTSTTVAPPSSVQPPQKKGGREGRRGRGSGLFRSADQLD